MDSDKLAKSGFLPTSIAVLALSLLGLGSGYAFSMLSIPDAPAPVTTEPPRSGKVLATTPSTETPNADAKKKPDPADDVANFTANDAQQQEVPDPIDERINLKDFVLGALPPIITNLAEPANVWVRLDGFLVIKKATEIKATDIAQQIAPVILSYLKTTKAIDLQGRNGINSLYSDLNEIVRTASNGDVHSILLTGFIVE